MRRLGIDFYSSQGQLADYNLLVDKLNTDTDRADVELECRDLKLDNDGLTQEAEQLWADKRAKEAQIAQLELELEQARSEVSVAYYDDPLSRRPTWRTTWWRRCSPSSGTGSCSSRGTTPATGDAGLTAGCPKITHCSKVLG